MLLLRPNSDLFLKFSYCLLVRVIESRVAPLDLQAEEAPCREVGLKAFQDRPREGHRQLGRQEPLILRLLLVEFYQAHLA